MRHSLATYTPHVVDGQVVGIVVHVADVTRMKTLEKALQIAKEEAERLAAHDVLTGLPNRLSLAEDLRRALAGAERRGRMAAVMSLDLDDFKHVNDTYGHDVGDRLLIEVAARLRQTTRDSDVLVRLGGDEFLLLSADIESIAQVEAIAGRIVRDVGRPVRLNGTTVLPTLSVGIALYPQHGTTPEALMASSDRALYLAKKLGRNRYAFAEQHAAPEL